MLGLSTTDLGFLRWKSVSGCDVWTVSALGLAAEVWPMVESELWYLGGDRYWGWLSLEGEGREGQILQRCQVNERWPCWAGALRRGGGTLWARPETWKSSCSL